MPSGNFTTSVAMVDGFEIWRSQVRSLAASYQDQNTGAFSDPDLLSYTSVAMYSSGNFVFV